MEISSLESLDCYQVRVDRSHTEPMLNNACFQIPSIPIVFQNRIRIPVISPEAIRTRESFCLQGVVPSLFHCHTFERTINLRKSILQMDSQSLLSVEGQPGFPLMVPEGGDFAIKTSLLNRCCTDFVHSLTWSDVYPHRRHSSQFRLLVCGTLFFLFGCKFGFGYLYLY